jgi:VanZ family protein
VARGLHGFGRTMIPGSSAPMPAWSASVRRALAALPAALWVTTIFILSSQPRLPALRVVGFDKIAHFGAFAVLALLVIHALLAWDLGRRRAAWLAVAISIAYGALDELHQAFVPGRVPSLLDLVADAAGAAVAAALWYGARPGGRREERSR